MNRTKAVFLDKDGVINVDKGFAGRRDDIEFYPQAGNVISYLRRAGYLVVVVTNQPIVARGIESKAELEERLSVFQNKLKETEAGAAIDGIYYCPHHPIADVPEYRVDCDCRKPKPGMLLKAAMEWGIDLEKSFMVGDRISDIIAGRLAGCTTVQFLSGRHNDKMIESSLVSREGIRPDHVIRGLEELKGIIR